MELSNLQPAEGSSTAITSEEAVDMVQETAKPLVRDIKVRRLVQGQQDRALKAVRCLYTDVFLREALQTETLRKL